MDADTVIIGGGPAGLTAAFFLSPHQKTTVIEKLGGERFSAYHSICGEGISEDAFSDLRPIEPWHIRNHIDGTRIIWPDGTEVYLKCKGYVIDRPKFLSELKKKCEERGTEFVNMRAKDVRETGDGYEVTLSEGRTIKCKNIVGADGAFSIVRKKIFDSKPSICEPVMHYITERMTERAAESDLMVYLDEKYHGTYKWVFPSGDKSSVGFAKVYDKLDTFISESARYLPFGGVGRIAAGNAYLTGDAAAMANPVSFGGLKAAMLSGRRAAESILRGNSKYYEKWWRRSILSSKRFMRFHERLNAWTNEDMAKAVKPFANGHIVTSAIWAALTRPWNTGMYIGCLFAFKFSW